jgi:hypothetical protein
MNLSASIFRDSDLFLKGGYGKDMVGEFVCSDFQLDHFGMIIFLVMGKI